MHWFLRGYKLIRHIFKVNRYGDKSANYDAANNLYIDLFVYFTYMIQEDVG